MNQHISLTKCRVKPQGISGSFTMMILIYTFCQLEIKKHFISWGYSQAWLLDNLSLYCLISTAAWATRELGSFFFFFLYLFPASFLTTFLGWGKKIKTPHHPGISHFLSTPHVTGTNNPPTIVIKEGIELSSKDPIIPPGTIGLATYLHVLIALSWPLKATMENRQQLVFSGCQLQRK